MLGADLRPIALPKEGVLLTGKLADILGVEPGDRLRVEVLEAERPVREVAVAGRVDELLGLNAYMEAGSLQRLMREQGPGPGAFLRVDCSEERRAECGAEAHARGRRGESAGLAMLASFESTLAQSFGIFTTVLVLFASVIACAMVYNSARIALSERGRELASLRVLGFTRDEVAGLLLGEQALLTLLALPARLLRSAASSARPWRPRTSGSCSGFRSW